jgi:uncharacterized membrane protein
MKHARYAFAAIAAILLLTLSVGSAFADTPTSSTDAVVVWTAYPSIDAQVGKSVTFSIQLNNTTQVWQQLNLSVDGPSDWTPTFNSGGYTINSVMVEPGKSQTVDLNLKSPANAKIQDYSFVVKGVNQDGVAMKELHLTVTLQKQVSQGGVALTTQYPNIRGQASAGFTFKVTLNNQSAQDRTINVSATAPANWQVVFKPSYETTQVTSFSVKAGATQDIDVTVTPPSDAKADSYKITMDAASGQDHAEIPLTVEIVGQPSLSLSTSSGQLNTQASVDSPAKLSLVVKNTGSQPLQNISLTSSSPTGWSVTFQPDTVAQLAVGQSAQVDATIKPSTDSLAGDYMDTITASASGASDSKDIRTTVETPTAWGWGAVVAIVAVVGGLGFVFNRFSRR